MKRFILLFVCLTGIYISAIAQKNEYPEWKTYLEGKEINQIINSGDYLWLTANSDRELIQFEKATGNTVHHIFEDKIIDLADAGDYFWLLTYHEEFISYPDELITSQKLLRFEKATGNIVSYNFDYYDSDIIHSISSIFCDNSGLPWIYSYCHDIFKMTENKDWILVLPKSNDPLVAITSSICFAKDNIVWISQGRNLIKYMDDKTEINEADGYILGLTEDKEGNIWTRICKDKPSFKTVPGTITKFDGLNWSDYYYSPLALSILSISDNGTIWLHGSLGIDYPDNFFIKFDSQNWNIYEPPTYFRMRSHAADKEGLIWIGTWDNGLIKSDGYNWNTFDDSNSGLPSNRVNAIFIDTDQIKWIGTDNGLVSFGKNSSDSNEIVTAAKQKPKMISEINIFPNPASDYITIRKPKDIQYFKVDILNIQGNTVKTFNTNDSYERMDVSFLPDGVYLVRIQLEEKFVMKKFVKQ